MRDLVALSQRKRPLITDKCRLGVTSEFQYHILSESNNQCLIQFCLTSPRLATEWTPIVVSWDNIANWQMQYPLSSTGERRQFVHVGN